MTAGVPREARSLNGTDIGREVWVLDRWRRILAIQHNADCTRLTFGPFYVGTYDPHDIVQVRGRTP